MSQDSKVCAFIYNKKKHVDLSLESSLPPSPYTPIWIWKGTTYLLFKIRYIFISTSVACTLEHILNKFCVG
jgi:hypothetical protein